jgi:hypothetical protein
MSVFASERARAQLVRILSHVSFPGLGLVLDREGQVVAAAGGLSGASVDDVVDAFGAHEDAALEPEPAALAAAHRVHRHELPAGYLLLVVVPCEVTVLSSRIDRAAQLLERMLFVGALTSPGDSGGGAPASVAVWVD